MIVMYTYVQAHTHMYIHDAVILWSTSNKTARAVDESTLILVMKYK